MHILFVCMGNICRSPTAEGVFRSKSRSSPLQLEIESAGTIGAHIGEPPDPRSTEVAGRRGYDLSSIRSRKVTDSDFSKFDLILAMDHANLRDLQARCPPVHQEKLKLFLAYGKLGREEVPDPYYGGPNGFDEVLDLIEDASDGLLSALTQTR